MTTAEQYSVEIASEPPARLARRTSRGLGWRAWTLLALGTALPIALLAYRVRLTGQSGHMSLPWDLFLGWVPLMFVVPLRWVVDSRLNRPRRLLLGLILGMCWLLFFPNSPYLITELIHLHPKLGPSENPAPEWARAFFSRTPYLKSPIWLDLFLLTAVAACGVLQTLASLGLMHGLVKRRLGPTMSGILILGLLYLTSFGIGLGRFDRLNSWDVFKRPVDVAERISRRVVYPREYRGVTFCTLVLGSLLSIGYFATREMVRLAEPDGAGQ